MTMKRVGAGLRPQAQAGGRAAGLGRTGRSLPSLGRPVRVGGRAAQQQRRTDSQIVRAIVKWEIMQPELYKMIEDEGFTSMEPGKVIDEVEAGNAILIDVRLPDDYKQSHAVNAQSIPLFQGIQTLSLGNAMKQVFYTLNGVKGTEENPSFNQDIADTFAKEVKGTGKRMYIMCDAGGVVEAVPGFLFGKQSRSLQACYKACRECGVPPEQLGHVKGGLREWAGAANLGLQGEDIEAWKKKAGSTPV
mmetsp:Transcript_10504/g.26328  ORF Transcript_10504/g.26328 Transcript_10504/m.26328 type:complete len:247 (+) Transcript_10504:228-968(+)